MPGSPRILNRKISKFEKTINRNDENLKKNFKNLESAFERKISNNPKFSKKSKIAMMSEFDRKFPQISKKKSNFNSKFLEKKFQKKTEFRCDSKNEMILIDDRVFQFDPKLNFK